ncbi:glycoside hydrolase family 13 protein [Thermothelomyces thermophilus ATCC 42464]|uniref:Alpha-glucosidase n=1 Tax=Thermothelomyces thermophilus (strain ATCC 42464 / BCRC 31852 / DSM 1799) TaxID=573729 RepID=G2QBS3_THET4|nr:glycoside hydrolase family 13 protein [Thermothelomyces thermophilus ATCC 42464]AEO57204.1 glycoside hydrolase family 13 protein [Thermothelomyces thermophilus ATCC 42464]
MTVNTREKQWWKQAVVYQIYPASFCDSNGDGIGDLPGITSKLDYIASLGVDVIWICPMYDSPQVDMGYDISNYEDVYRPYGTVQDMETLIKETHARGMRIMLDLVINHTSDQHAWFKESRSSKDSPKRDWYIWRPAKYSPSGERLPPNNWRCNFGGGSAWEWDELTQEYYLHLFATEQPDLNWENPETRKAIYASAMEFWLKRGVDGFRIDTVNMYSKPPTLPDAPIVDPGTPYQPAGMIYCNGPRMHEFLSEMNAILTKYGAITVGELPCTPDTSRVLQYVSAKAKQLNMVFQFDVVDVGMGKTHKFATPPRNFTLPDFKAAVDMTQALIRGTDGWSTVFIENHDQARSVSRFTDDRPEFRVRGAKLLALMQACLSGTQYIYQGQEIGLVNLPKDAYPIENYKDIDSTLFYDMVKERYGADNKVELDKAFDAVQYLARDHARVPIPWNGQAKYGGFSEAAEKAGKKVEEPWMKTHPLASEINVASQLNDPDSVLAFWRKMLRFRQAYAHLLVYGDFKDLRPDDKNLFMYLKEPDHGAGDRVLVVLNFTTEDQTWNVPSPAELGASENPELIPIMATHSGMRKLGQLEPFEGQVYLVR